MGWKIYFGILTFLIVTGTGITIAEILGLLLPEEGDRFVEEPWALLDWLDIPLTCISLVGVFCFAYKKTIGKQIFWKRWFIFILVYDISYNIYDYYPADFITEEMWLDLLAWSLFIPYYLALYFYGYKSDELWNSESNPPN